MSNIEQVTLSWVINENNHLSNLKDFLKLQYQLERVYMFIIFIQKNK